MWSAGIYSRFELAAERPFLVAFVDNAMLGRENTLIFRRTSAVEYLLG